MIGNHTHTHTYTAWLKTKKIFARNFALNPFYKNGKMMIDGVSYYRAVPTRADGGAPHQVRIIRSKRAVTEMAIWQATGGEF